MANSTRGFTTSRIPDRPAGRRRQPEVGKLEKGVEDGPRGSARGDAESYESVPQWRRTLGRILRHRVLLFGLVTVVLFAVVAAFPQILAPYDPLEIQSKDGIEPPSAQYLLGLDNLGRDVLSRTIHGARASLLVALGAVTVALLIGVPLGLFSGFFFWDSSLFFFIGQSFIKYCQSARSCLANSISRDGHNFQKHKSKDKPKDCNERNCVN